jgi:hypothetical protein
MKYCLKYTNICTKLNKADEISIKYIEDKGLVDFMEKFKAQRIILHIDPANFPQKEVRKLIAIHKQYPQYNFAVALPYFNTTLMSLFLSENIPFFVAKPCSNWEEFHYLLRQRVSDIDISGPLAFEMSKVKQVLDSLDRKVIIRATPNRVEKIMAQTNSLIGFFIRPEDVEVYEGFIDVLEFEGLEHQDTFFSIYAEQKTFIGNLNQCIYGFDEKVDNKGLVSLFGERRRDCGRQCLNGGHCRRCFTMANISHPMGDRAREYIMEILKKEQEKISNGKDLSD